MIAVGSNTPCLIRWLVRYLRFAAGPAWTLYCIGSTLHLALPNGNCSVAFSMGDQIEGSRGFIKAKCNVSTFTEPSNQVFPL